MDFNWIRPASALPSRIERLRLSATSGTTSTSSRASRGPDGGSLEASRQLRFSAVGMSRSYWQIDPLADRG